MKLLAELDVTWVKRDETHDDAEGAALAKKNLERALEEATTKNYLDKKSAEENVELITKLKINYCGLITKLKISHYLCLCKILSQFHVLRLQKINKIDNGWMLHITNFTTDPPGIGYVKNRKLQLLGTSIAAPHCVVYLSCTGWQVRIFTVMEAPVLDAIGERLRQHLYIGGSKIFYQGGPIDKMVFIVRGKMESIGEDGNSTPLSEGDVCGEELLTWCLDHPSLNRDAKKFRSSGQRLFSNRTVQCLTNVEGFALRADDLEEVTAIFARVLRNSRVQAAIRYESPYWRTNAAICIQVAWRYRKKRLGRRASRIQSHIKQ
ncbi:hypothetical protein ACLOJK_006707 [Asimina triloba]